jgi:hypothetical protein
MSENKILISGLALVTGGCSMAYLPLGPIVLGVLLLGMLFWSRLRAVPAPQVTEIEGE